MMVTEGIEFTVKVIGAEVAVHPNELPSTVMVCPFVKLFEVNKLVLLKLPCEAPFK